MNHTPGAAGNGGTFDPQQAAALLGQTTQQARRQLEPNPPWVLATRAVMVLAALGAIWLSVRGQHPYQGPSGTAIAILYLLVAIVIAASVAYVRRANAGVRGKSRAQPGEIAVLATAWIAVYVFQGALYHAGVSHAIAYGIYPATAPLMVVGLVGAALAQGRANWPTFAACLTVAVICCGAAYAGPAGAWAVAGLGLFVALLVHAGVTAWLQRA